MPINPRDETANCNKKKRQLTKSVWTDPKSIMLKEEARHNVSFHLHAILEHSKPK